MHESFDLSWDNPEEIEQVRKFLRFHAKRLKCSEYEVLVKMGKELDKGVLVEVAKGEALILPKRKKEVVENAEE